MPEGDTIKSLAERLSREIAGKVVTSFSSHAVADDIAKTLVGKKVQSATARGKNLLIEFEDGRTLHIHLRMYGRVRIVRPEALAQRRAYWGTPKTPPQLELTVDGAVVLGDKLPILRLLGKGAERRAPDLASLGPDLLAADFDEDAAIARVRKEPDLPIGEAIMMQRLLAGIGNVYKSEILFIEKVHPRTLVRDLDDEKLRALVRCAKKLMTANVKHGGPRYTRSTIGEPHWVYGRARRACFKCKGAIAVIHQGAPPGRSTYFCPQCQKEP